MPALAANPLAMRQVVPVPTGFDGLGFPTSRPLPGGVPNPPGAIVEAVELAEVRADNARTLASPAAMRFTEYLADRGGSGLWTDFAKQYRQRTGFARGWAGTALMFAAMGVAALRSQRAKYGYQRARPFEVDPSIRPVGKQPRDRGYPSGHASSAYAAATVLEQLWPSRAHEFAWWARQTALSRVHAGVHFPSDVQAGAILGIRSGIAATSILR